MAESHMWIEGTPFYFWMRIKGADPVDGPVRVVVTVSALEHIDPSQPRDFAGHAQVFGTHRQLIEAAAYDKFKRGEVANESYEGSPVISISSDDLL